jgi:hypothetical protein
MLVSKINVFLKLTSFSIPGVSRIWTDGNTNKLVFSEFVYADRKQEDMMADLLFDRSDLVLLWMSPGA